jgi:putative heme-binding domain-containing protein
MTLVALKNGNILSGILKDDGATSVTIALPGGVTQTVLRKYISKVSRRPISLMPSYAGILSPEDAANVISWLQAQRN